MTSYKVGQWLYDKGNAFEAYLYGLRKVTLRVGDTEQVFWTNNKQSKPAIIMLHGYSASHAVWLRFARYFTAKYWVIIPDLAGHGETGFHPAKSYSIPKQSERISNLMKSLHINNAHIIGNSMGGFIAAHMGRHYPDLCRTITLFDPAGVKSPKPSKMLTLLASGRNPFLINNREEFNEFYSMVMARPPFLPNSVLSAIAQSYRQKKAQLEKIFSDYNQMTEYLDTELHHIRCPSLVLWGAQDQLIHVSSSDVWQTGLSCTSIVWDDLGHMPMLEAPKRSAQAVLDFFTAPLPRG